MSVKNLLRDVAPPVAWRAASRMRAQLRNKNGGNGKHAKTPASPAQGSPPSPDQPPDQQFEYGQEQPSQFYDMTYHAADHWKRHYTASRYYPLWTVVADRVRRRDVSSILDIGCGPGQVACLLRDRGVKSYHGLDFSTARIERARDVCPAYQFSTDDVFQTTLFQTLDYDCALVMEFLEHIEQDLGVLEKLRSGTLVLATVPNFPAAGHVRHFTGVNEVRDRYRNLFSDFDVTGILENDRGKEFYLFEGRRL